VTRVRVLLGHGLPAAAPAVRRHACKTRKTIVRKYSSTLDRRKNS
jgi:hypothetical protein